MKPFYTLLKLLSVCLASVLFLIFVSDSKTTYTVADPDSCRLNVTVLSDCHIEGNNISRYKVYANILNNVKHCETPNDAVVFLGDNTMNGQNIESVLYYGALGFARVCDNIIPVMGNHDVGNGEGDYNRLKNRFLGYAGQFQPQIKDKPYYTVEVKGYTFIVLAPETNDVYEMTVSDEQYEFLENALKTATKDGKPVFVCCHYPLFDIGEDYGDRLEGIFAAYPNVFYLSGHTHMPCYDWWTFCENSAYNEINLPRCTELTGEKDNELLSWTGLGVQLEVYDTEVFCRVRNYYSENWYEDLSYHFELTAE